MLNGQNVDLVDAFCKCPDWATWLTVYSSLLTGSYYGPALRYAGDPFLYGYHVWKAGWATDPNYLVGTGAWMARLYDLYADTLVPASAEAAATAERRPVPVRDGEGKPLCDGWLDGDKTIVPLRSLAEGLGYTVTWDEETETVTLTR